MNTQGNSKKQGKVIMFDPSRKQTLKNVDYVDPAKKELKKKREKAKQNILVRNKMVTNAGIFIGLCLVAYLFTRAW